MTATKRIVLCADDFGQDKAISDGILQLAGAGRLSAVSCFSDAPLWRDCAPELIARGGGELLIGLHFNLTMPFGYAERPLRHWMLGSMTGRLSVDEIRAHLQRQIDSFVHVRGRLPDFIDGHQHVHAFPGIRSVVHEAADADGARGIPIRDVSAPIGKTDAPLKRRVIRMLANWGPAPANASAHWMNRSFAGDYSLSVRADFAGLFADWLAVSADGGLIMCHPGRAGESGGHAVRERERAFLASDELEALLSSSGCSFATRSSSRL